MSIAEWLPVIAEHFPGSGITVFTVYQTTFDFWQLFVARAKGRVS